MDFFYTTTAGLFDFAIFLVVVALGAMYGARQVKWLALIAVVLFIYDRATLLVDGYVFAVLAMLGCLAAISVVLQIGNGNMLRGFAALYGVKLAAWTALVAGAISFETLATVATLSVYGQLFIILGGAIDGPRGGRINRSYRASTDSLGRGWNSVVAVVAGGRTISRHPELPQQGMATNQDFQKEGRGAEW